MAASEAIKEAKWLKGLIGELLEKHHETEDRSVSLSALHFTRNQMNHQRTKHIDIRLRLVRDIVDHSLVDVTKISTKDNPTDIVGKLCKP